MSKMSVAVCVPSSLISTHMEQMQAMEYGTTKAMQLQLVLLPPYAEDVTPETPAQQVGMLLVAIESLRNACHAAVQLH
jgi:hypothetical protein